VLRSSKENTQKNKFSPSLSRNFPAFVLLYI
jgi:hypothetical protein